ncbi:type VII secretion protein EccE [Dietzia kunjamensis]|uniref:type VII secretion protein EccE n=1 Tax=Dietzia kunjamensis TaxID=322509 RepID=UPI002DB77981|nr:type VII secretion protein EccE [Dietzia kunjamensis]MEB8324378.1 type VII secretion protein EccE [Dietzia kunjamensis]
MTAVPTFTGLSIVLLTTLVLTVVCPPSWQPWVQFLFAALVAAVITTRRGGRPLVARDRAPRRRPVDLVDLVAPDRSTVGCVEGERVVTTAVEISAGALVATEVGRDDPADHRGVRLPLAVVARQLDQGGVVLEGIDVVVDGRRAADGDDGEVYDSLVGPLALISHRRVHLLVRFDLARLATGRGSASSAAGAGGSLEQVVAVATERLRRALVHHGVPCRVLDAAELAGVYLDAEADPGPGTGLVVRPSADPRAVIDGLTAVRAARLTEVIRLRRVEGRDDVVDMVTTVGLAGVSERGVTGGIPPTTTATCHPLPSGRVSPVPGETLPDAIAGSLARRAVDDLADLAPPAHGCGQILGATRTGAAAAIQLAGPHLRSVLLAARPAVCRQVAFRAVAAGYRVAVVTDVPDRWSPLTAIGDETRYRIVDPDSSDVGAPVDAVMWDVDGPLTEGRIDALAGPGGPDVTPPTVIRVDADWELRGTSRLSSAAATPDLVLDGRIDGWISVEPRDGEPRRVSVVAGPGEDPFIGPLASPDGLATDGLTPSGAAPSATPDHR